MPRCSRTQDQQRAAGPVDIELNPASGEFAETLKGFMALPRYIPRGPGVRARAKNLWRQLVEHYHASSNLAVMVLLADESPVERQELAAAC